MFINKVRDWEFQNIECSPRSGASCVELHQSWLTSYRSVATSIRTASMAALAYVCFFVCLIGWSIVWEPLSGDHLVLCWGTDPATSSRHMFGATTQTPDVRPMRRLAPRSRVAPCFRRACPWTAPIGSFGAGEPGEPVSASALTNLCRSRILVLSEL